MLYTEEQVAARVREVAAEIDRKYQGRELKLIAVLKGSVYCLTALSRVLTVPVKIDFLGISSFSGARRASQGMVRIAKDLDDPIQDEDVLLIEDIVDTGLTTRLSFYKRLPDVVRGQLGICTLLGLPPCPAHRSGACRFSVL